MLKDTAVIETRPVFPGYHDLFDVHKVGHMVADRVSLPVFSGPTRSHRATSCTEDGGVGSGWKGAVISVKSKIHQQALFTE